MSHDLQLQVDNGDGTTAYPSGSMTPMRGNEFDHLPDSASTHNNQPQLGAAASLQYIHQKLQQSSHPVVIIFHILFKAAALVTYIFGGWFTGNDGASFITITVACVLLLAADFWTVKNVTGRLLVGLRWWNKVEDETTTWIFESAQGRPVNPFDQTVFWTVLYLTPMVWLGLFILGLIRFKFTWLMIVVMALALNGANVYGYYKCSGDQKARFEQMSQNYAQQGAYALVRAGVMGFVSGGGAGSGGGRNVV